MTEADEFLKKVNKFRIILDIRQPVEILFVFTGGLCRRNSADNTNRRISATRSGRVN